MGRHQRNHLKPHVHAIARPAGPISLPSPQAQAAPLIPTVGAVLADLGVTVERLKTLADDAERDGGLGMRAVSLRELRGGLTDTAKLLAVLRPLDPAPAEVIDHKAMASALAAVGIGEREKAPAAAPADLAAGDDPECRPARPRREGPHHAGVQQAGRRREKAAARCPVQSRCRGVGACTARRRAGRLAAGAHAQHGDLAALCGRRVGKSQSAGWVAAHHVVEGEGRTALCISPTQRQSSELFRLAKAAIVKALPDVSFPPTID